MNSTSCLGAKPIGRIGFGAMQQAGGWLPALSPEEPRDGVEANLRSLHVERVDLVNLRLLDEDGHVEVPVAEQLGELDDLRREGKLDLIGVSNVTRERLEQALALVDVAEVLGSAFTGGPRTLAVPTASTTCRTLLCLAVAAASAAGVADAPGAAGGPGQREARVVLAGRSVQQRPIRAMASGAPGAPCVLVVGVVHGNEPAGAAIARDLVADPPPARARLVVVPSLNPDGMRAATRQNARGVDLNRNFPYRFHRIGAPFDEQYPGPAPLSEPESRFAATLIERIRPAVSVWFHQPLGLVDLSGGNAAVERSFARLVHLPPVQLTRYPGSAAGWQNHRFPGTTSFVVELPRGRLRPADVERYADAILRLAEALPPRSRSG